MQLCATTLSHHWPGPQSQMTPGVAGKNSTVMPMPAWGITAGLTRFDAMVGAGTAQFPAATQEI